MKCWMGVIACGVLAAACLRPTPAPQAPIHWTVTAYGAVEDARVENDTLNDPQVSTCIVSIVQGWTFPRPTDGGVEVSFPFVFQSTQ